MWDAGALAPEDVDLFLVSHPEEERALDALHAADYHAGQAKTLYVEGEAEEVAVAPGSSDWRQPATLGREEWNEKQKDHFERAMYKLGRQLHLVARQVPGKSLGDVLRFYYKWKCTPNYVEWRRVEKVKKVNEEIPDWHNDVCDVCDEGGTVVCCDTCNLSYHPSCLAPKLVEVPTFWMCPVCRRDKRTPADIHKAQLYVNEECGRVETLRQSVVTQILGIDDAKSNALGSPASGRKRQRGAEGVATLPDSGKKARGAHRRGNGGDAAARTSNPLVRRANWQLAEVAALVSGVREHGRGKWGLIKRGSLDLRNRSVKELEDKWMKVNEEERLLEQPRTRVVLDEAVLDDRRVAALPERIQMEFYAICWGNFHGQYWPCCIVDPRDTAGTLREMAIKTLGQSHLVVWLGTHDFSLVKYRDLLEFDMRRPEPKKMTDGVKKQFQRALEEAEEQLQLPAEQRMLHLWRNST